MTRRKFTGLLTQSAAAAFILGGCSATGSRSCDLVSCPEKRKAYLDKMLKALCTDLGPHPIGSEAYNQAALIIKQEMELALPGVVYDQFTYPAWKPLTGPELYFGDKKIETYASHGCPGTPQGGIQGIVSKTCLEPAIGNRDEEFYCLVNKKSAEIIAYITTSTYGRTVVLPYYSNPLWPQPNTTAEFSNRGALPMFNVGKQDIPLLEEAIKQKTLVRYDFKCEFIPDTPSGNIAGTLPGETDEEILFVAHADTPYNSPGANDNTATMICMIMLAHAFSGKKLKKTVTFLATTGEEYGKLGAVHYKERREKEGTLNNIKVVYELDSLTWGNNLQLYSTHRKFSELVAESNNAVKINGTPQIFDKDSGGDLRPFRQAGIPTVFVNSRGKDYEPKTLHLWHRPEDTPDGVHAELIENGFLVFQEAIKRLQES